MARATTARLAWVLLAICVGLVGTSLYLAAHRPAGVAPLDPGTALFATQFLFLSAVGALIASRQPRSVVGWLLLGIGVVFAASGVITESARRLYAPDPPLGAILALTGDELFKVTFASIAILLLLIPNGRLPSPRWRWLAGALGVVLAIAVAGTFTTPGPVPDFLAAAPPRNPIGVAGSGFLAVAAGQGGFAVFGGIFLLAAASLVQRFRKGDAELRLQLKWIALAGLTLATTIVAGGLYSWLVHPGRDWFDLPFELLAFVAAAGMAAAIGIAILRHRLFDIDLILSRALAYGLLSVLVTGFYIAVVAVAGTLLAAGSSSRLVLAVIATAAVAAAFQPLRSVLLSLANRLVYGDRARPYEVLAEFTARISASRGAAEALPTMARLLAEGTRCERATVWLVDAGEEVSAATWPDETAVVGEGATRSVEVRHGDELLGRLAVRRSSAERLSPTEERLMDGLAIQAGLLLRNAGLQAELGQRLEELRASRRRLVRAQDDERRRLERDLHDGAQQNLVSLRMKLGLAEAVAGRQPEDLQALLREMQAEVGEALESLRMLARGVYPPLLEAEGLGAALNARARLSPIPIEIRCGTERYPREIEGAIYFCCAEALQNIAKHASARRGCVHVWAEAGQLRFEVTDDGRGFPPRLLVAGGGIQNMRDRIEALGGVVTITTHPSGTCVSGSLPLRSTAREARAQL